MAHPSQVLISAAVAAIAAALSGPVVRALLRRRGYTALAQDLERLRWPVRALAGALFISILAVGTAEVPALRSWSVAATIAAGAWVVNRLLVVAQLTVVRRLGIDHVRSSPAAARRTQLDLLRRVVTVIVTIAAVFLVAVSATPLRSLGPTLVAYAGLIGVVLGLALRAPLENLVAGIIVAVTEPIRIGDVVVVQGDWGKVEQIGLVNVVVRIWDERRLVLPTAYFVDNAFENLTRGSTEMIATVVVWADYSVPIDDVRAEFHRIIEGSPMWDGREAVIDVVELSERAVKLRALATVAEPEQAWSLRVDVREQLLRFLQDHPAALPRVRAEAPLVADLRDEGDHVAL